MYDDIPADSRVLHHYILYCLKLN